MASSSDSDFERELGTFTITCPWNLDILSGGSSEEELSNVDDSDAIASTIDPNINEIIRDILQVPTFEGLPPPQQPVMPSPPQPPLTTKRFKTISKEKREKIFESRQSSATKKNTAWGVKVFQDWNTERFGSMMDMHNIASEDLAEKLEIFYCQAQQKPKTKKSDKTQQNNYTDNGNTSKNNDVLNEVEYTKSSLKSIRSAINRHLTDIKRNMNIVKDDVLKTANGVLEGIFKEKVPSGKSRPVKHKQRLESGDLSKIAEYFHGAAYDPVILRQSVWYYISMNFVTRGMEFHHQLYINSFIFHNDDSGEYVTISHETIRKNNQGGLYDWNDFSDKRMYTTNTQTCPVTMLKYLIEKN